MLSKSPETVVFIVNLTLLVATGTWLCVWLLYYTDKFDDFAKILALGGGLTWLAFLLKLLPDERLKALQGQLDGLVFSRWWLTAALIIAFAVGLYTRAADILVVAAGSAGIVTPDMVKPGAAVVSAGATYEGRRVIPDVEESVAEVASWITPRLGGVGPTTRAMLLSNTVDAAERRSSR